MWNTLVFSFPFLNEMEASIYKWNDQIALQDLNLYDWRCFPIICLWVPNRKVRVRKKKWMMDCARSQSVDWLIDLLIDFVQSLVKGRKVQMFSMD